MAALEKKNQSLLNLIKKAHSAVENTDIEKHRQSQDYFGALLGNNKETAIRELDIDGMYGEWISVNRAHMKKHVILYCHGGGYSTGSSLYARTLTTKLAMSTSMDVLCFDYRLAPEHPYPAALEDAVQAWDYLMLLGYGARDVIVAGDSAGGNLALSLVLKLQKEDRIAPRGLVLMSPWTDMTMSGKSYESKKADDPVLSADYIKQMIDNYAANVDKTDPFVSPVFGDYTDFPPTYIQVGEHEILLNDATMLHKKMVKANVLVQMDTFDGMWHVFQMSPFKTAYEAMDKNAEFIYNICR